MDAKSWDRQPYWAQRIYIEGLYTEKPWEIKLDLNPETWWSPLNDTWDAFGELGEKLYDKTEPDDGDESVAKNSSDLTRWKQLPDISELGMTITRINATATSS